MDDQQQQPTSGQQRAQQQRAQAAQTPQARTSQARRQGQGQNRPQGQVQRPVQKQQRSTQNQATRATQGQQRIQGKQQNPAQRQANAQVQRQNQERRVQQAKRTTQKQTSSQAQRAQERKRAQQPRRSTGEGFQMPTLPKRQGLPGQGMSRTTMIAAIAAIAVVAIAWFATGGFGLRNAPETPPEEPAVENTAPTADQLADEAMSKLTLEQKIAQMFIVTPEELTSADTVIAAGDVTRLAISDRPVGGIIYFDQNLQDPSQTREMLANTQKYSQDTCGLPMFLAVDEEGGEVTRIASNWAFEAEDVGYTSEIGASGNTETARNAARQIGSYLSKLGFNTDFAPVADIAFDPWGTMGTRSFGDSASVVAPMVEAEVKGFSEAGIISCAKHFPGIGAAEGDSHYSSIYTSRTLEDMQNEEFVPFKSAIAANVPMIMVGHVIASELDSSQTPASLSKTIITDILRSQLGYDGIIITDSITMAAISDTYSSEEASVAAIQAGADIVLMPPNFDAAYRGVLSAVQSGQISEERINESVRRIVKAKLNMQNMTASSSANTPEATDTTAGQQSTTAASDTTEDNSAISNDTTLANGTEGNTSTTSQGELTDSSGGQMTDLSGESVQIEQADPNDNSMTSSMADQETMASQQAA